MTKPINPDALLDIAEAHKELLLRYAEEWADAGSKEVEERSRDLAAKHAAIFTALTALATKEPTNEQ